MRFVSQKYKFRSHLERVSLFSIDFCYFCAIKTILDMKKTLILTLFMALFTFGHAQPKITEVSAPTSVGIFGLYEISFQMGDYPNPYDPKVIDVYAEFVAPDGTKSHVNGFYFEEYTFEKQNNSEVATAGRDKGWRIRFTPDQTGTWTYSLNAIDSKGKTSLTSSQSARFSFQCTAVASAQGFIRLANQRYLKREVFENGQKSFRSFFPIGPNIAWYGLNNSYARPKGIYDYDKYINSISGSANYMRIWINRSMTLSLYGIEYTQTVGNNNKVYFNSTLNQKDAAELDHIIEYAARHNINIMPCIFTFGDYCRNRQSESKWENNPYNTMLGLESSTDFFTDTEAKRIAKNFLRYIVARWGYATNIMSWELWNEVENIPNESLTLDQHYRNIISWHEEMSAYLRSTDPFHHLVSTSTVNASKANNLYEHLFQQMDFAQIHNYGNIQKAKSKEERSFQLLDLVTNTRYLYPDKPCFIGEFAFGQSSGLNKYKEKDPYGFDAHNCLWASVFSGSMGPGSFWYWEYLEQCNLLRIYEPMLKFCEQLPLLSDSFTGKSTANVAKRSSTVFPNGIETLYMVNAAEDTLYGWCQDSLFSYQGLRRLTDKVGKNGHFDDNGVFDKKGYVYTKDAAKKPRPCSNSNTISIPISKQPVGTRYIVRWYDTETGLEMPTERTTAEVKGGRRSEKSLSIEFPSSVRDLKNKRINNTFGDAVFSLTLDNGQKEGSNTQNGNAPSGKSKTIRVRH